MARRGEELDIEPVDRWLKSRCQDLTGTPEVTQYSGGASNWTYRLKYPERDLVLRRPPAGTKPGGAAHDMVREYSVQERLRPHFPQVPEMIALCRDSEVIGCDFYVMARIDGIIPRAKLPPQAPLDAAGARKLCQEMLDRLIALHGIDHKSAGLDFLSKGTGYVHRQVEGWIERYEKARTWNTPGFKRVGDWLRRNAPNDVGACVIHNDWRFDNLVLDPTDPTKIVGVLDWELATIGDPLMELGSMLAYWVERGDGPILRASRRQPTHLPGMMTRKEVVNYYMERTGLRPVNWTFYEVFGLFRLAAIAQQIYYRYHHGQSRNRAFRHYWFFIHVLNRRCLGLIQGAAR